MGVGEDAMTAVFGMTPLEARTRREEAHPPSMFSLS